MLGFAFDHDAIETLVLTRRSWLLMEAHRIFGEADNEPAIHKTFWARRTDRVRVLDELIKRYCDAQAHRGKSSDRFVVPHTNFFLHHQVMVDDADWESIATRK